MERDDMSTTQTDHKGPVHLVCGVSPTDDDLRQEIADLAARFGTGRGTLVPLLRDIKSKRGSIPLRALDEIAYVLGMDYAKVHSVASFYTLLDRVDRELPLAC
jgi:NADH:ubiquinone oxidoreductase subunit E